MPLMKYLYIMEMDKGMGEVRRFMFGGIKRVDLFTCGSLDDELNCLFVRSGFTSV